MAKINTCNQTGVIIRPPLIGRTSDGEIVSVSFFLKTCRFTTADEHLRLLGRLQYDVIPFYTTSHYVIEHYLKDIKVFDIINTIGTLVTQKMNKKSVCPTCKHRNEKPYGVAVFVEPEAATVFGHVADEDEANAYLKKIAAISNQVIISGTVCQKNELYKEDKIRMLDFQIASNRLRHAKGYDPNETADYPWVKSYGEKSVDYDAALQKGSEIVIQGAIETRTVTPRIICDQCGAVYRKRTPEPATEIVPYAIDYIKDCIIPEPKSE